MLNAKSLRQNCVIMFKVAILARKDSAKEEIEHGLRKEMERASGVDTIVL